MKTNYCHCWYKLVKAFYIIRLHASSTEATCSSKKSSNLFEGTVCTFIVANLMPLSDTFSYLTSTAAVPVLWGGTGIHVSWQTDNTFQIRTSLRLKRWKQCSTNSGDGSNPKIRSDINWAAADFLFFLWWAVFFWLISAECKMNKKLVCVLFLFNSFWRGRNITKGKKINVHLKYEREIQELV